MLFESQIEIVRYAQMATWADCNRSLPRNVAAVYAWFRDLRLSKDVLASECLFVDTILELLKTPLSIKRDGRIPPFYEIGLRIMPATLSETKEDALKDYAKSEYTRKEIGAALEAMTFLQPPLYIGKANNLITRTWQHINGNSNLRGQLEKSGLSLRNCLLAYVPISTTEGRDKQTSLAVLVEDIITNCPRRDLSSAWAN